eukprot:4925777-Alexandrium_andersonii.AAC.1
MSDRSDRGEDRPRPRSRCTPRAPVPEPRSTALIQARRGTVAGVQRRGSESRSDQNASTIDDRIEDPQDRNFVATWGPPVGC